jgi:hypothetical protein
MQISTTLPTHRPPTSQALRIQTTGQAAAEPAVAAKGDRFTFGPETEDRSAGRALLGVAVGVGVGVFAGLNTGTMAGLAGAAVTALPGAFVGGISGALVAERIGQSDSSSIVGAGLWGAILGGLAGATGGALLGAQANGIGAALGLGAVGGITGLMAAGS